MNQCQHSEVMGQFANRPNQSRWTETGQTSHTKPPQNITYSDISPNIYFAPGRGAKYCDVLVVCVFIWPSDCITQKPHGYRFFLYTLPVAMARSLSLVAMRCVKTLPVCGWRRFHAKGPDTRTTLYFEEVRQLAVPAIRQTTTVFARVRQNAALGAKSAIYDCLVTSNLSSLRSSFEHFKPRV